MRRKHKEWNDRLTNFISLLYITLQNKLKKAKGADKLASDTVPKKL
jgi:hypothetical protein